jgi:phage terminase large subunit-like protein
MSDWRQYVKKGKHPKWVQRVIENTVPRTDEGQNMFYFDVDEAVRRVEFIQRFCRYPEGPKAGELMILDEWQKEDIVYPVFGWKRRDTATSNHGDLRRYRRVFIGIPRKNAKSTLIAAMALSIMLQDGEHRAEVYCLASNEKQGERVMNPIKAFCQMEPALAQMMKVRKKWVDYGKFDSRLEVLASTDGRHGLNTHAVLIDELHEFLKPAQLNALEALTSSTLARAQPLQFTMTTAGSDVNSRCYHDWEYCLKVKDGVIHDDTLLPVIYAADDNDNWQDEQVWKKANPGLGTIISLDNFKEEYLKAKNDSRKLNTFLRLHLNIWAQADERWIDDKIWVKAASKWPDEAVKDLPLYIGMDLAATRDTCAAALLWVDEKRDKYYLRVKFWQNEAQARSNNGVDYLAFEREGSCEITPGDVTDHEAILRYLQDVCGKNRVQCLAYDKHMATLIVPQMVDMGIRCEPFSQSILSVSYPIKQFDVDVAEGKIVHDGSMMMRWQMSSAKLHTDNSENVKIIKKSKTDRVRVDGPVAAIIAYGQMLHERSEPTQNIITEVIGLDF